MSVGLNGAFADLSPRVWLNCSHQGALPLAAAAEAREAIDWKLAPFELTQARFDAVPERLRTALARLIGASADDIALTNGASYGLHLLANGLLLEEGDEVLLLEGDFPSNLLPWVGLEERGVIVRRVRPIGREPVLQVEDVEREIGARTKVLCTSWVHSFSGWMTDLKAVGEVCRAHGAWFVVNSSQGVGARSLNVEGLLVDALVSVGWKYLCGPYATGFCWLRPELREVLQYNQRYWLSIQRADDLGSAAKGDELPEGLGARRYDVFAPANFFNCKPLAASVEMLVEAGMGVVEDWDQGLVARLIEGLDELGHVVTSPRDERERASIVVFSSQGGEERNGLIHRQLADRGLHLALRRGCLRAAPHVLNNPEHIDRLLEELERLNVAGGLDA